MQALTRSLSPVPASAGTAVATALSIAATANTELMANGIAGGAALPDLVSGMTTTALGGVTASYLAPAAHLPLVRLIPARAHQETRLTEIVDAAATHSDQPLPGSRERNPR